MKIIHVDHNYFMRNNVNLFISIWGIKQEQSSNKAIIFPLIKHLLTQSTKIIPLYDGSKWIVNNNMLIFLRQVNELLIINF